MTERQKEDRAKAIEQAQKVIRIRVNLLRDSANAMEQNIERMTLDDPSSAMYYNWAVNDLQAVLSNLGMPELCRTQVNIDYHDNVLRESKS